MLRRPALPMPRSTRRQGGGLLGWFARSRTLVLVLLLLAYAVVMLSQWARRGGGTPSSTTAATAEVVTTPLTAGAAAGTPLEPVWKSSHLRPASAAAAGDGGKATSASAPDPVSPAPATAPAPAPAAAAPKAAPPPPPPPPAAAAAAPSPPAPDRPAPLSGIRSQLASAQHTLFKTAGFAEGVRRLPAEEMAAAAQAEQAAQAARNAERAAAAVQAQPEPEPKPAAPADPPPVPEPAPAPAPSAPEAGASAAAAAATTTAASPDGGGGTPLVAPAAASDPAAAAAVPALPPPPPQQPDTSSLNCDITSGAGLFVAAKERADKAASQAASNGGGMVAVAPPVARAGPESAAARAAVLSIPSETADAVREGLVSPTSGRWNGQVPSALKFPPSDLVPFEQWAPVFAPPVAALGLPTWDAHHALVAEEHRRGRFVVAGDKEEEGAGKEGRAEKSAAPDTSAAAAAAAAAEAATAAAAAASRAAAAAAAATEASAAAAAANTASIAASLDASSKAAAATLAATRAQIPTATAVERAVAEQAVAAAKAAALAAQEAGAALAAANAASAAATALAAAELASASQPAPAAAAAAAAAAAPPVDPERAVKEARLRYVQAGVAQAQAMAGTPAARSAADALHIFVITDTYFTFVCEFLRSALLNGAVPHVVGFTPKQDAALFNWGLGKPLLWLRPAIAALAAATGPSTVVMIADAHDTILTATSTNVIARFRYLQRRRPGMRVLITAERSCFPISEEECARFPVPDLCSPYRNLNSGGWMGEAGDVLAVLDWVDAAYPLGLEAAVMNDQAALQYAYLNETSRSALGLSLDYTNQVFMAVHLSEGEVEPASAQEAPWRFCNTVTGGCPALLHYNGGSKPLQPGHDASMRTTQVTVGETRRAEVVSWLDAYEPGGVGMRVRDFCCSAEWTVPRDGQFNKVRAPWLECG
jgi:hypothetical protein